MSLHGVVLNRFHGEFFFRLKCLPLYFPIAARYLQTRWTTSNNRRGFFFSDTFKTLNILGAKKTGDSKRDISLIARKWLNTGTTLFFCVCTPNWGTCSTSLTKIEFKALRNVVHDLHYTHRWIISASQATPPFGFATWWTRPTGANTRGSPSSSTRATRETSRCSRRTRYVLLR